MSRLIQNHLVIALIVCLSLASPLFAKNKIKGSLYSLDPISKTMTLKNEGIVTTFQLVTSTKLSRNGITVAMNGFVIGDKITASYKNSLYPSKVKGKGVAVTTAQGMVQNVNSATGILVVNGKSLKTTFRTEVVRNGKVGTLVSLLRDDNVTYHETEKSEIEDIHGEGLDETESSGAVTMVDTAGNTVEVTPSGTTPILLTVNTNTQFEVGGLDGTISNLLVGMYVIVEFNPATMAAFKFEADNESEDAEIEGTLTQIDLKNGTVTIQDAASQVLTLAVDASTCIDRDDLPAFLSDLQIGDPAKAEYNSATLVANEIEVELPEIGDDSFDY